MQVQEKQAQRDKLRERLGGLQIDPQKALMPTMTNPHLNAARQTTLDISVPQFLSNITRCYSKSGAE